MPPALIYPLPRTSNTEPSVFFRFCISHKFNVIRRYGRTASHFSWLKELTVKFPFFLASACFISCGLLNPSIVQANTLNISSATVGIDTASPSSAQNQARRNKARIEEPDSKLPGGQAGNSSTPRPQMSNIGEEQTSHRARSFILFLQMLRSAK